MLSNGTTESESTVPVFLRFRSWIGSDRDGNPNVTADVTRTTLAMHRRTALSRYLEDLRELRRDLSISEQHVEIPDSLQRVNRRGEAYGEAVAA